MCHFALGITTIGLLTLTLPAVAALSAQGSIFPNVKNWGRAISEYRDSDIQAVVNYEYSQRHPEERWMLIEVAVGTQARSTIHRDGIRLVTPSGRELRLASQERFLMDGERLRPVFQNARIWRRPLDGYFSQRGSPESIRFFAFPGQPVVHDDAVVNRDIVAMGDLLFETPNGRWSEGTYRLIIRNDSAKAELPIRIG